MGRSKVTPSGLAEELLKRQGASSSLIKFVEYTHPNWKTAWYHVLICEYLERLADGRIEKLAINAPPRHGKTELASRRFPAWLLGKNPEWQIISTSSGIDLASDIGADVRDIIKDPLYQNVFPDVQMRSDAGAAGRWRLNKGGIYIAGSVGSQIVGRGANIGIIDDPHKSRAEADSERMRNVVMSWYMGEFFTRLMPPYAQLLIMTRWHEADLAGSILPPEKEWMKDEDNPFVLTTEDNWTVIKLPAIFEDSKGEERALGHHWYPLKRLREIRKTMNNSGRGREWRSQYQQEPVAEEGTFLQRAWFDQRFPVFDFGSNSKKRDQLRVYMAGDFAVTSSTEAKDPDRTELGVFGISPDDKIYVLDWWSGQTTADVWVNQMCNMILEWKPFTFFGEVGVIRRATEPLIKRRMRERRAYCRVEWMPTGSDKLARGRTFQAWASSGRVILPDNASWADQWIHEVISVPSGRYWDKFDTISHMCLAIDKMHPAVISAEIDTSASSSDYSPVDSYGDNIVPLWKVV